MLKFGLSLFGKGFKSSKCKTMAKLVTARIKLLRNKREVVVRQMRRDVALLLQSGQDATARIRVEHVMREQNIMAANEIIELFCELVVARLSIIAKQRECPADLKEGISSLMFAAPRCSDIPELLQIRTIFKKKYGEEFVNAATELRPNCGVNRILIEKLSVRTPTGEAKLKLMKEIAKEYQIAWDHTETEKELLKPPEELIEGPHKFVSATSMPVKREPSQWDEPNQSTNREMNDRCHTMNFENTATAAKVAAESAEKAVAAAQAAAYLANRQTPPVSSHDADGLHRLLSSKKYATGDASQFSISNDPPVSQDTMHIHNKLHGRTYGSQGYDRSSSTGFSESNEGSVNSQHRAENIDIPGRNHESHDSDRSRLLGNDNNKRIPRRHSYNSPAVHSDINFDESDGLDSECDEEIEMEKPAGVRHHPPPERSPPPVPLSRAYQPDDSSSYRRNSLPRVHPKLPDYEDISARFEALKNRL